MNTDRFKFRVWDKEKREYLTGFVISPDGTFAIFNLRFRAFSNPLTERDGYVLEQCTGLKDKNGNLIYEGDIVQYNGKTNGIVLFRNGSFVWDWKINDPPIYGLDSMDQEIIGNIHDNELEKLKEFEDE